MSARASLSFSDSLRVSDFFANNLWDAIAHLIDLFEPHESANHFAAAGYDPD